jgi:hypothetical protein
MLLTNGALDILAQRNIIDLNEIYKGLLFPYPADLTVNNISNFNVKAFHWELVFNKVRVLCKANNANGGCEDELFVDIEPLFELLLIVFC